MKTFPLAFCLVLIWGCSDLRPEMNISTYFDVDSLVNRQVKTFDRIQPTLEKSAKIDDRSERQTLRYDSSGWARELTFFRQLNINEPSLVGGYTIDSTDNVVTYTPDEDLSTRVRTLSIHYSDHRLEKITGLIFEENEIYATEKDIEVNFEDGLISKYRLRGFQKIILKDTARFEIEGIIK